jgi:outer membrane protein, heavy metal efflux system
MRRRMRITSVISPIFGLLSVSVGANAQVAPQPASLVSFYEAAWLKQPEAIALAAKLLELNALKKANQSWTQQAPTVDFATRTDRVLKNQGSRDYGIGISAPLWLSGESKGTQAVIESQVDQASAKVSAAKLRTAAVVRNLYWAWQRAKSEFDVASDKLLSAQAIATDVMRREKAGDLAKSDSNQASGVVALAQGAVAETAGNLAQAYQRLVAFSDNAPTMTATSLTPEPLPANANDTLNMAQHPLLLDLKAQAATAKALVELAKLQKRGNPEVSVSTARERSVFGDSYQHTIGLGLRIPIGSNPRYEAKVAVASTLAIETEGALGLETSRINAEIKAAEQRVLANQKVRVAAEKRVALARETRGFFEKSFRLGETDLPTRLRIELELAEAERQLARNTVEQATAISDLRQAYGLLPE